MFEIVDRYLPNSSGAARKSMAPTSPAQKQLLYECVRCLQQIMNNKVFYLEPFLSIWMYLHHMIDLMIIIR